jgi:hypothetical protein
MEIEIDDKSGEEADLIITDDEEEIVLTQGAVKYSKNYDIVSKKIFGKTIGV